jgi:hypothetical protein
VPSWRLGACKPCVKVANACGASAAQANAVRLNGLTALTSAALWPNLLRARRDEPE